jgi:hypothetical protein
VTDPRAGDVAETERLLAEAAEQGTVKMPTLSRAELWVLCGDNQVLVDDAEASWWHAITEPDRENLGRAMLDLLADRGLLRRPEPSSAHAGPTDRSVTGPDSPGSLDSDWAGPSLADPYWAEPNPARLPMTPPLALVIAARQAPAVIAVATAEDGSAEGAPRMYGLAAAGQPPRAVVAEIISDKANEPFGRLHHFALLSVSRGGHALATWAAEGSRGRLAGWRARKGPGRIVDIYRYNEDEELRRDHVEISPGSAGGHEVTLQSLGGEPRPATMLDTGEVASLLTKLLSGESP